MDMYTPLSTVQREIRLITLYPGGFAEDIRCEFHMVSLDECPVYEALSYVWGDPSITRPIFLNTCVWHVTANLESALRHLRWDNGELRTIWIDALCINQRDILERSQQVGIMQDIYGNAQDVLVWLGERNPISAHDEQTIQDAYSVIKQLAANKHLYDILFFCTNRNANHCSQPELLSAIRSLMKRPWWKRIWVVQETSLPPHATLVCGRFIAEWDDFASAGRNIRQHMTSVCCEKHWITFSQDMFDVFFEFQQTLGPFNNVRQRVQHDNGPRLLLWELLVMFRSQEATDPRDKVYALLGLVTEWLKKKPLLPGYSLTTAQVYKKAVLEIITDMESLLVLTDCVKKNCYPQMPSWVPDWTASQGLGEANLEWAFVVTDLFNASGSRKAHAKLFGDSILGLHGIRLGTVCHFDAVISEPIGKLVKWRNTAEALWSALGEPGRPYPSGGSWQNAFLRTVLGDLISPITNVPVRPGEARAFRRAQQEDIDALETFCAELNASTSGASLGDYYTQADHKVKELLLTIVHNFERQGYFMTSNGYMGLGPNTVCAGDEVWVLMGSPVPFILHPLVLKESDEMEPLQLHQLVGHCFVHGIMDGEATENFLDKVELVGIV